MRAGLEAWLHRQWACRGILSWLLSPLSLVYWAISQSKLRSAIPERVGVPVVVVGNIYVGGTGKTPITIRIAQRLAASGFTPGIISRGYGRSADDVELVSEDSPAATVGDEPLLIAQTTGVPVAVGRNRVAAAKKLLAAHPEIDVIISDDGLQHRKLHRDVELAVVGARGLGNGWVLPAGPLREPPSRLDSVDAIILNATTDTLDSRTPRFAATSQLGQVRQLATNRIDDIDNLSKSISDHSLTVVAAAGIAMPQRFFAMLSAHDIEAKGIPLPDHFDFHTNPFEKVKADIILITGKDAVKCRQIDSIAKDERIWVADLETKLDPYLIDRIIERIRSVRKQ